MNNCTIIVSSCDKYEDLWDPFFKLLTTYWGNCPFPIVLNTETKHYSNIYFDVKTINSNHHAWGARLIDVLSQIDSDYVILLLDDYFLINNVNTVAINTCISYMELNKKIANFRFDSSMIDKSINKDELISPYDGFVCLNESDWKCNFSPSLWRKKTLLKYLRSHESIWGFEKWGSIRAKRYNEVVYKESIYNKPIFPFAFSKGEKFASAVVNGKWILEIVLPIFEKHGISVNYDNLGTMTIDDYYAITTFDTIKKNTVPVFIRKCIGVVRSLI